MDEEQVKSEYLKAAIIQFRKFVKKFQINLDIPTQNYLAICKWVASKVFWGSIVFLFSIFTVASCLELLSQYVSGLPTSKIDIKINKSITFPLSTVCLPLYAVDFSKLDSNFSITNPTNYMHSKISEYFENLHYDKVKSLDASSWPPTVLSVVSNYISSLRFIENYEPIDTSLNFLVYKKQLMEEDWWKAGNLLEENIKMLNISIRELTQSFGLAVAQLFKLRISHYIFSNGTMREHQYHRRNFYKTSVSSDWICYNVDFSEFVTSLQDEKIVVSVNADSLQSAMNFEQAQLIAFAPLANFHMDDVTMLLGQTSNAVTTLFSQAKYYLGSFGSNSWITCDFVQVYQDMPILNGRQQCSELWSIEECRAQCRAAFIKNLCNCTATTLTTRENIIGTGCTLTTYESFMVYEANVYLKCDCLQPCTRWNYKLQELVQLGSWEDTTVNIQLKKFDYRIFQQTYLWKMDSFLGAFGGALGLWLGLDFLMIIKFFSAIVTKLIKINNESRQPSSSTAALNLRHNHIKERGDAQKNNQANSKEETGIRIINKELLTTEGIKLLNFSCQKILSLIVMLVFSLATVFMCVQLIQQYYSDQPSIEQSVAYNRTIQLPISTEIILPMYSVDLELNIPDISYSEKVDRYFGENPMNKKLFLNDIDDWPSEIFAICFRYIAYLSAVEGADLAYGETMNFSTGVYSGYYSFLMGQFSDDFFHAAFHLEKNLQEMNVTIEELKLCVVEKLKIAFQLSVKLVSTKNGIVTKQNISRIENTCIGYYRLCFKADFSNMLIESSEDYIEISSNINRSTLPERDIFYLTTLTVDLYGRIMRDVQDNSLMQGSYGWTTTFSFYVIDMYRKIPSVQGNAQCMDCEWYDQCRWQCRSQMIYEKCDCTTLTLPQAYSSLEAPCSFSIYDTCLQYSILDDMQCIKRCLRPCEHWNYEIGLGKRITLENTQQAIVQLYVQNFDYPKYIEKLPWTFETFAGAIGGMLGFWMGLDFVIVISAILQLIGFVWARLFQFLKRKKINPSMETQAWEEPIKVNSKHQNESDKSYFTSLITEWLTESFKTLKKAIYPMKPIVILKLIIIKTGWSILVIFFCLLTFIMCYDTAIQYLKNETEMNMQIMLNKTFTLPKSIICLPIDASSLDNMIGFGEKSNKKSKIMKYFTRNQESKNVLLSVNKQWPLDVYSVIHKYLFVSEAAEANPFQAYYYYPMNFISSYTNSFLFQLSDDEWKAIFELEPILNRMNVSRGELRQAFGQQTLMIYDVSIAHINEENNELIQSRIEIGELSSIDEHWGVCYKINFSGASISSEAEQVSISIDSNGLSGPSNSIIFALNVQDKVDFTIDKFYIVFFGIIDSIFIGANEVDQVFPQRNGSLICEEHLSQENCRWECRANLIKSLCNCTASSLPLREVQSIFDECTLAIYRKCLIYDAHSDYECKRKCLRPCRRETYEWTSDNGFSLGNVNQLLLILKVKEFGYATFEEQYEWTFGEFLGALGGNLGMWMAIDVKLILKEIFSVIFVIGKYFTPIVRAYFAGNAVIIV